MVTLVWYSDDNYETMMMELQEWNEKTYVKSILK